MARTTAGDETREKLLRAAEELFAARGLEGALTRDIIRLAGQSNPSAVQYHFGSRQGLLDAIMASHRQRTEHALADRLPTLADATLEQLLAALVAAESTELRTGRGLRCLRISARIGHRSGVRSRTPHPALADSGYWRVIELAENRVAVRLPELSEPLRLERLDLALTLIGAALSDRAQLYLDGTEPLVPEELFLADLVAMTAALLCAPTPRTAVATTPTVAASTERPAPPA